MRVLLIKANHIIKQIPRLPQPLGILTIGTILKQLGDEVKLLDYRLYWRTPPVEDVLIQYKPDLVGISALTTEIASLHELAYRVRMIMHDVPIVVGGPHVRIYTKDVLSDNNIDYGVLNEGERTILSLRETLLQGGSLSDVKGLAWRDSNGKIHINPLAKPLSSDELNKLPLPDLSLLDFEGYLTNRSSGQFGPCRSMAILTSRGCPYGCTYCDSIFGKKVRFQSPERVLEELTMIYEKYGLRSFEIFDDAFLADKARAIAIMERIIARRLPLRIIFANGLRGDILTHEMIDLFAEAGTIYIGVGIETSSPRLQRMIKKNLNLDRLVDNVKHIAKRRIFSSGFFMLGFPTETYEEAKRTIDFACNLPLHSLVLNFVTPFKETPMGNTLGEVIVDPVIQGSYTITSVNVSEMSSEQLFGLVKRGYMRFFANPTRVYRLLRDHPNRRFLPNLSVVWMRYLLLRNKTTGLMSEKDIISKISESSLEPKGSRSFNSTEY